MLRYAALSVAALVAFIAPESAEPYAVVAQEEAPAPPRADPADVESIDAIIASLYAVISGDKGEPRDWERFESLFHPELGRLIPLRPVADGSWVATGMTPADYAARAKDWTGQTAFYEREIARTAETFGGVAHVWSTYAGFDAAGADEPFVRGVNSIQLMQDGKRWWLLTVTWDAEGPDQKLPKKYLPK